MAEAGQQRLHTIIEGRVQGVGFRYFILENAVQLGLTGWVRNRWDGSVEVTAEGGRTQLEELLALLYRGPRSSFVTAVHTEWLPAKGEFAGFHVAPNT